MIKLIEKLLNLIYIQPCYFCHSTKEDSLLCSKCRSKIHFMPKGVYREFQNCDVYACTTYDDIIKKLIRDLKYNNQKKLAKSQSELMFEYWQQLKTENEFIVLPVPIHKLRRKERKYNHMDIVAEEFAKLAGYKVNKNFIVRTKDTLKQYNLHKQERIKNIKNAFDLNLNENIDKTANLLIIDDITSTGITFDEIIRLLKKNGYKNVTALALATPDIWN